MRSKYRKRALREIDRVINALSRPKSALAMQDADITVEQPVTHMERKVILEFRQCFATKNGLTIYDIGAHRGAYAQALAKVTQVERIISFEPLPDVFTQLEFVSHRFPKISPLNTALGDANGTAVINRNDSSPSSSILGMLPEHWKHFPHTAESSRVNVRIGRLDDLVIEHQLPMPDIVKIDVQGFEDKVLLGGSTSIGQAQWLMVEMSYRPLYNGAPTFHDLYEAIIELGFRLEGITDQLGSDDGTLLQANALFGRR